MKHKHYDLIVAWAEGNEIEVYVPTWAEWTIAEHPSWEEDKHYRIKQTQDVIDWEHVSPEWKWMARDEDGSCWLFTEKPSSDPSTWYTYSGCIGANAFSSYKQGTTDWLDSLVGRAE